MSKIINIKCNVPLLKNKKDAIVQVLANDNGVPQERFWRRRLADAKIDNCCEIVEVAIEAKSEDKESKKSLEKK